MKPVRMKDRFVGKSGLEGLTAWVAWGLFSRQNEPRYKADGWNGFGGIVKGTSANRVLNVVDVISF